MSDFEATRTELAARRGELLRRIAHIEDDLERHGLPAHRASEPDHAPGVVLGEFMEALHRELGLVESSIRRIDNREYDCCMQCGGTIRHARLQRLPYAVNCASCSRHFPIDYIDQLRGHNASLRRTIFSVLGIISDVIDRCDDSEARPHTLAPTLALLGDLGRQLPERFHMEEQGGYLSEALAAAPRYSRKATKLMQEHADFTRRIAAIVKEAERADGDTRAWVGVRSQFRQLSLDLLAHEQAEADILESAFLDDLGGPE